MLINSSRKSIFLEGETGECNRMEEHLQGKEGPIPRNQKLGHEIRREGMRARLWVALQARMGAFSWAKDKWKALAELSVLGRLKPSIVPSLNSPHASLVARYHLSNGYGDVRNSGDYRA
jgi:hypothetical protein